jgi:hypothetical protein
MASAEFSFATTANQVATLFADEIKGKIGALNISLQRKRFLGLDLF